MTPDDLSASEPFWDLIARACDGLASPEELDMLDGALAESAENRKLYLDYVALHASLNRAMSAKKIEYITGGDRGAEQLSLAGKSWAAWRRRAVVSLLSGAAGVLILLAVLSIIPFRGQPWGGPGDPVVSDAPETAHVARVTEVRVTEWGSEGRPLQLHAPLAADAFVDFRKGELEITFGSGARVLLQGATRFQVASENAGALAHGRLTALVPRAARGFRVSTAAAEIIDLGTEFGAALAPHGELDVHVFQGSVELEVADVPSPEGKVRLVAGEAAQITPQNDAAVAARAPTITRSAADRERFAPLRGGEGSSAGGDDAQEMRPGRRLALNNHSFEEGGLSSVADWQTERAGLLQPGEAIADGEGIDGEKFVCLSGPEAFVWQPLVDAQGAPETLAEGEQVEVTFQMARRRGVHDIPLRLRVSLANAESGETYAVASVDTGAGEAGKWQSLRVVLRPAAGAQYVKRPLALRFGNSNATDPASQALIDRVEARVLEPIRGE